MASSSDFKVKQGLQIQGSDINLSNDNAGVLRFVPSVVSGSDTAGKDLTISSGESTGSGTSTINLATATAGSSGTTRRTVSNKVVIGGDGVTTFTAGGDLDIGSHDFKAETLTSDIATGNPPLVVASATNVPNLNASSLSGATFAAPGAIGGTTAAAGTFTALTGTSLTLTDGNITNVGDINADSISVDAAAAGLNVDFSGANTGLGVITLNDGIADALSITDGTNDWMVFNTSAETLTFGRNSTFAGTTIADLGTVTTANIDGGSVDGATVGAASASTGAFTTLTASEATTLNGDVTLGNATGDSITNTGRWLGDFVPEVNSSIDLGTSSLQFAEAHIDTGYIDAVSATSLTSTATSGNLLKLAYDAQEYVGHTVSSGGVYQIAVYDDSSDSGQIKLKAALGTWVMDDLLVATKANGGTAYRKITIGDSSASNTDADRGLILAMSEQTYRLALNKTGGSASDIIELGNGSTNAVNTSNDLPTQAQYTTAKTGLAMGPSGEVYRIGDDNASSGEYLTFNGTKWVAGSLSSGAVTALNNATATELVTIGSTTTELDAHSTFVFDGTDATIAAAGKMEFRDAAIFINSSVDGQLDIDADGEIEMNTAILDIDASTSVSINTPGCTLTSSVGGSRPIFTIESTHDDATGPTLTFNKNGTGPGDNDVVGSITFDSEDSGDATTNYGSIVTTIANITASDEAGKMELKVAESDGTTTALTAGLTLTGAATTDGQVDVTLGAGSGSTVTIPGSLDVNGTLTTIDTTNLSITDALVTVARGNDTLANADGAGIEVECSGATNPTFTYQATPAGWESNVNMNLNSGLTYKINDVSILSATTIHANVTSASGLTTVGALNAGSITSGFTSIDVGAGAISTTGTVTTGALTVGGDIGTAAAQDWDLIDNTASALSFDATGKTGILEIDTTNSAEGVNMSGHLLMGGVALMDAATGTITDGANTTIYSWPAASYSAAKFIVSVWKDDNDDYRNVTEILCTYDGATAPGGDGDINMVEYAMVEDATGGNLGTFDVDQDGGTPVNIRLRFDPGSGTFKWRLHATLLAT